MSQPESNINTQASTRLSQSQSQSGRPSQHDLLLCALAKSAKTKNFDFAINATKFMEKHTVDEQWAICKKHVIGVLGKLNEYMKTNKMTCHVIGNQIFFPKYKMSFGSDRIGFTIAPDTYGNCFIEMALLQPGTLNFLDLYGYENQEPKLLNSFEEVVIEFQRIYDIYKIHEEKGDIMMHYQFLGTGKTCTALIVAEALKKMNDGTKITVLMPKKLLTCNLDSVRSDVTKILQ